MVWQGTQPWWVLSVGADAPAGAAAAAQSVCVLSPCLLWQRGLQGCEVLDTNSEPCQDALPIQQLWEMSLRDMGQGKTGVQCTFVVRMRNIEWQLHVEGEENNPKHCKCCSSQALVAVPDPGFTGTALMELLFLQRLCGLGFKARGKHT